LPKPPASSPEGKPRPAGDRPEWGEATTQMSPEEAGQQTGAREPATDDMASTQLASAAPPHPRSAGDFAGAATQLVPPVGPRKKSMADVETRLGRVSTARPKSASQRPAPGAEATFKQPRSLLFPDSDDGSQAPSNYPWDKKEAPSGTDLPTAPMVVDQLRQKLSEQAPKAPLNIGSLPTRAMPGRSSDRIKAAPPPAPPPTGMSPTWRMLLMAAGGVVAGLLIVLAVVLVLSGRDHPREDELRRAYPFGQDGAAGPNGAQPPGASEVTFTFKAMAHCPQTGAPDCQIYEYAKGGFVGTMLLKKVGGSWVRASDDGMPK
jgi:hypothetical protein